jgi:alpha-mannosidase
LGDITGTILDGARQADRWLKKILPTQTIISWPVNNHWDTNFAPEQEGIITNTYRMELHGAYDAVMANRFGMQQHRPLIAVPAKSNPVKVPMIALDNAKIVIAALKVSDDKKAMIVRLRSVSNQKENCKLTYPAGLPKSVFICSPGEKPLQQSTGAIELPQYGTVSLRVVF